MIVCFDWVQPVFKIELDSRLFADRTFEHEHRFKVGLPGTLVFRSPAAPTIAPSMLLKSCAILEARVPIPAIFSDYMSCSSFFRTSVKA